MNKWFKYNRNVKVSLLQILLKSTLVIGLSACNSSANQSKKVNEKGEQSMLDEIFNSGIKSDQITKIQENRADVNIIVFKHFHIGESKQEVVFKLHQMGVKVREETNGKIIKMGQKKSGLFDGNLLAQILNITFEFDQSNKLRAVKSMYFTQQ